MKPCTEYVEKILLSIDGQLTGSEEQALKAHLAVCEGCRSLYAAYKEIDLGISETEEEAPENLSRAVMAAIHRESRERSPLHILKRARFTLIAAAAALVILVAGKYISFDFPSTHRDASSAAAETCADEAIPGEVAEAEAPGAEAPAEGAGNSGQLLPAPEAMEVPEEAPEEPMEQADDGTSAASSTGSTERIQEVLTALREAGYSGGLYPLSMTEAELLTVLPDCEKISLSSGIVVFQTSLEAHNTVSGQLCPASSAEEPQTETVFYYLMP